MDVLLLKLALGLYSIGLVHSVLSVLNKKQTFFGPALAAMITGFVSHVTSIVIRGFRAESLGLTHGYESVSIFAAVAMLGFLAAYWKYKISSLSVFVFPAVFIMAFIADLGSSQSDAIHPDLRSRWIYIHTPLVILGYAALFIAFSAAVMYLIQERKLKSRHKRGFYNRLPSLEICDDLAYRSLAVGFPLMTLGIISGALWAQEKMGPGWIGDVKVLLSFLTWFIYLGLIQYRLIGGWRGRKAAYLSIVGFIGVLATFLGASSFHVFNH